MSKTKKCIVCRKELKSVGPNWNDIQPCNGGEVRFIFSYGSCEFDLTPGVTEFRGVICDDCATQCVEDMERFEE